MNNLSLGTLLMWFAIVIFVPAIVIHFTLGRKGGHHLYDDRKLSPEEIRRMPFEMSRRKTIWHLKGAATTIAAVLIVAVGYPLGCLVGLPINALGISDRKLTYFAIIGVVVALTLGPTLYRKWRGD